MYEIDEKGFQKGVAAFGIKTEKLLFMECFDKPQSSLFLASGSCDAKTKEVKC